MGLILAGFNLLDAAKATQVNDNQEVNKRNMSPKSNITEYLEIGRENTLAINDTEEIGITEEDKQSLIELTKKGSKRKCNKQNTPEKCSKKKGVCQDRDKPCLGKSKNYCGASCVCCIDKLTKKKKKCQKIKICQQSVQVMSPHHSDQMSQR